MTDTHFGKRLFIVSVQNTQESSVMEYRIAGDIHYLRIHVLTHQIILRYRIL
jgi:hypothetical protein